MRFGFVQGSFPIFVTDAHLCPICYKVICNKVLAPEAGIMQWCVPMFIGRVGVCFALDELSYNIAVSVAGGKVQRCVVSAVHDVDASPSHDEHVHHAGAALPAGPVQWAEAVVISLIEVILGVVQPEADCNRIAFPTLGEDVIHSRRVLSLFNIHSQLWAWMQN